MIMAASSSSRLFSKFRSNSMSSSGMQRRERPNKMEKLSDSGEPWTGHETAALISER
jgi:hypothetical protein